MPSRLLDQWPYSGTSRPSHTASAQNITVKSHCNTLRALTRDSTSKRPASSGVKRERSEMATPDAEERVKRKYDSLDPDILDCPLCADLLSPPVFQCKNGHIACSHCCEKIIEGCPWCSEPIGHMRCLAKERVLESVQVSCKHAVQGCQEMLKYSERVSHEIQCEYGTYHCPARDCKHEAPMADIPNHFLMAHQECRIANLDPSTQSVKFSMGRHWPFVVVQSRRQKFLIHSEKGEALGDVFFCTAFGSSSVLYTLKVHPLGGSASYFIKALAPSLQRKGELPCKKRFVLVPACDEGPTLQVELSLQEID